MKLNLLRCLMDIGSAIITTLKLLVGYKTQRIVWLYKVPQDTDLLPPMDDTLLTKAVMRELGIDADAYDINTTVMVGVADSTGFNVDFVKGTILIPKSIYDDIEKCGGYTVLYNLNVSPPNELVIYLWETRTEARNSSDWWHNRMISRIQKQNGLEPNYGI